MNLSDEFVSFLKNSGIILIVLLFLFRVYRQRAPRRREYMYATIPVIVTLLEFGLRAAIPEHTIQIIYIAALCLAGVIAAVQVLRGANIRKGQHNLLVIKRAGYVTESLIVLMPVMSAIDLYLDRVNSTVSPGLILALYLIWLFFWSRSIYFTNEGVLIDWRMIPWSAIRKVTIENYPAGQFDEIVLVTDSRMEQSISVRHAATAEAFAVLQKKIPHVEFEQEIR